MTTFKSQLCKDFPWGFSLQNIQRYTPNWILTLMRTHYKTDIDVCAFKWSQSALKLTGHCSDASSWPKGQLFPWIHRGKGHIERHILPPRMYKTDKEIIWSIVNTLVIRPGFISTLYTHSYNQSVVSQLHFLASWTSFGIQYKSTQVFKQTQQWKLC
jgi:hypothetical protein